MPELPDLPWAGARLGVVTTSYPRWPGDAAGGFVAGHVAYLRATGADVEVIAFGEAPQARTGPSTPALRACAQGERREGAQGERGGGRTSVMRVDGGGLFYRGGAPEALEAHPARAAAMALAAATRLTTAVARRARRWDAVVAHWLAPSALAAALASGRPLLAVAHGGDVHLLARTRLLGPALRLLHARGATVAFVSRDLERRALAALPSRLAASLRTIVQPMGVDDDSIAAIRAARRPRPARARAFTTDHPATLVVLARLVPIKSVATAIAALPHLSTPARLLIAGDGPERDALARAAAPLGARVVFLGALDAAARDDLLAGADALLVPSAPRPDGREEGTPLAALEALASGVRVIASATGGLVDLAVRGAVLVPPDDPRALAGAIDRTLAGPPPALAEVGWSVAGQALDRAWLRVPRYAPGARATQAIAASRSDQPSSP